MNHMDFGDHELHCVCSLVVVIIEGIETHAFKDSEDKLGGRGVAVESNDRETPVCATNQEDIYALLEDGYKVDDDRLPYPKNKPSST